MPSIFASFRRKSERNLRKTSEGIAGEKRRGKDGEDPSRQKGVEPPALPPTVRLSGFGLDSFDLEQLDSDLLEAQPDSEAGNKTRRRSRSLSRVPAVPSQEAVTTPSASPGPPKPSITLARVPAWNLATARTSPFAGRGEEVVVTGLPSSPRAARAGQPPRTPSPRPSPSSPGPRAPGTVTVPLSNGTAARGLQPSSSFYGPIKSSSSPPPQEPPPTRKPANVVLSPPIPRKLSLRTSPLASGPNLGRTSPAVGQLATIGRNAAAPARNVSLFAAGPPVEAPPRVKPSASTLLPAFVPHTQHTAPMSTTSITSKPSLPPGAAPPRRDASSSSGTTTAPTMAHSLASRQLVTPSDSSHADTSSAEESCGPETPPSELDSQPWSSVPGKTSLAALPPKIVSSEAEEPATPLAPSPVWLTGAESPSNVDNAARLAFRARAVDVPRDDSTIAGRQIGLPQISVPARRPSPVSPPSTGSLGLPPSPKAESSAQMLLSSTKSSSLSPITAPPRPASPVSPRSLALRAARERQNKATVAPATDPIAYPVQSVERPTAPRFEYAVSAHMSSVFRSLMQELDLETIHCLRAVSRKLRRLIEDDAIELVLERFLGTYGYRRASPNVEAVKLDYGDLCAFLRAVDVQPDDYARSAEAYVFDPARFPAKQMRLVRTTTRAWNRLVIRLRQQSLSLTQNDLHPKIFANASKPDMSIYKPGRAACLRVWVPTRSVGWMTDQEVLDVEREVWKCGVWPELRKGDVVRNVAIEAMGNSGALVFDGRFLRDLEYTHDSLGHMPAWFDALSVSPSYFHNILFASSPNPVIYATLHRYATAAQESIALCKEKVQLATPQGGPYLVSRYVYRADFAIKGDQLIGDHAGAGGSGPSGIEVVHPDWVGDVVLEAEGSAEQAQLLLSKVACRTPTPWRVLREKSRPGRIWLGVVAAPA
ncbi:hypothetical protein JCM10908_005450 [Rhodotorula pacifica]|uniref:uncharacterized protein n=1 Tax=Rhodotorula pacifica TaxID=1495444 RepID=UPI00317FCDCA